VAKFRRRFPKLRQNQKKAIRGDEVEQVIQVGGFISDELFADTQKHKK